MSRLKRAATLVQYGKDAYTDMKQYIDEDKTILAAMKGFECSRYLSTAMHFLDTREHKSEYEWVESAFNFVFQSLSVRKWQQLNRRSKQETADGDLKYVGTNGKPAESGFYELHYRTSSIDTEDVMICFWSSATESLQSATGEIVDLDFYAYRKIELPEPAETISSP